MHVVPKGYGRWIEMLHLKTFNMLVRLFTTAFPMCMEISLKERGNVYFACVANSKSPKLQKLLTSPERFTSVASRLHLSQILNSVTLRKL
ncbi:hypothetical protein Y032_0303g1904 [Ancylostoma ceylanicum]|nr:hypothetical protein Y032_0303g1904 [Ancylostoma ceylanicum]